jgi:adenylate cyclase
LLFAAAMTVGAAVLYFVSRDVLLSSFRQLENEHMHQDLGSAVAALDGEYLRWGNTADDYAYWDQTYAYMADPKKGDISSEFQNGQMKGLGLDLVVFLDGQESIVFAKAYDHQENQEARIPLAFLQELFLRPQTRFSAVVKKPLDGIVAFPAGPTWFPPGRSSRLKKPANPAANCCLRAN